MGSDGALPHGAVSAIRSLRHRVPEGTPEVLADLAGESLEAIASVMRGKKCLDSFARLNAAKAIREEVCGPVAKKVEHSGEGGGPVRVSINISRQGAVTPAAVAPALPVELPAPPESLTDVLLNAAESDEDELF